MRRVINTHFIGRRFDRLTVVAKASLIKGRYIAYSCECDCGQIRICRSGELTRSEHIGCKACEPMARSLSCALRTHGECELGKTRLYRIWKGIRTRCTNPKDIGWKYYGGKGVRRCAEWNSFPVFKIWAMANGYTDDMTIDRLNSNGNYEPGNCEWVTQRENSRRMLASRKAA